MLVLPSPCRIQLLANQKQVVVGGLTNLSYPPTPFSPRINGEFEFKSTSRGEKGALNHTWQLCLTDGGTPSRRCTHRTGKGPGVRFAWPIRQQYLGGAGGRVAGRPNIRPSLPGGVVC